MGREASCSARLGRKTSAGKALLETTELLFRGDFRVVVPFKEMTAIRAGDGHLTVTWPGGTLALALGAQAAKWAEKIRNPPSRLDKLGVKPGARVAFAGETGPAIDDFAAEVEARGASVAARRARAGRAGAPARDAGPVDIVFLSAGERAALAALPSLKSRIHVDGAIWILRPKGHTAITEADVRAAAKDAGLVDVKVAAFSATHTAEKLVIPVAARGRAGARR